MINKVSFSNYGYNPAFKAEFSKDYKTQEILNNFSEISPVETFVMLNGIKKINSDDCISINREIEWVGDFEYPDSYAYFDYSFKNNKTGIEIKYSEDNNEPVTKYFSKLLSGKNKNDYKKLFGNNESNNQENFDNLVSSSENKLYKITNSENIKEKLNLLDTEIINYQKKSDEIMNKINNLKNTKNELNLTRINIFSEYVASMINNISEKSE